LLNVKIQKEAHDDEDRDPSPSPARPIDITIWRIPRIEREHVDQDKDKLTDLHGSNTLTDQNQGRFIQSKSESSIGEICIHDDMDEGIEYDGHSHIGGRTAGIGIGDPIARLNHDAMMEQLQKCNSSSSQNY